MTGSAPALPFYPKNMKMLKINSKLADYRSEDWQPDMDSGWTNLSAFRPIYVLLLLLVLSWLAAPGLIRLQDPTMGAVDPSIWLLLLFSLISFLLLLGLCSWLLHILWRALALPDWNNMVLHFKDLQTWQQLSFCWLSFALLLSAAIGVLNAIL